MEKDLNGKRKEFVRLLKITKFENFSKSQAKIYFVPKSCSSYILDNNIGDSASGNSISSEIQAKICLCLNVTLPIARFVFWKINIMEKDLDGKIAESFP